MSDPYIEGKDVEVNMLSRIAESQAIGLSGKES